MAKMKTLTIDGTVFEVVDSEAVHFTEQTLTEAQKAQARANIGAVTVADVLAALPIAEGGSF